jgi:hypothetical protein
VKRFGKRAFAVAIVAFGFPALLALRWLSVPFALIGEAARFLRDEWR